jgi:methylglyoxal synthase
VSASGGATATFVYDGDGNRVLTTVGTTTTAFIGNHTEWNVTNQEMTRYYLAGGQRVAFRVIKSKVEMVIWCVDPLKGRGQASGRNLRTELRL